MRKRFSQLLILVMFFTLVQPIMIPLKAYAASPDAILTPVLDKYEDVSGVYKDGDTVNIPHANYVGYYKDDTGDWGNATTVAKFDLSGLNDTKEINKAELFIYVHYVEINNMLAGHPFFVKLYGSSEDNWSDSARGIPAISDPPIANYDQSKFTVNGWTSFDVTNFVKDQTSDDAATFVFTGNPAADMNLSASGTVAANLGFYDSSYTTNHSLVPRLEITYILNSSPTDMTLNNSSVAENSPAGTEIGSLVAIDPDAGDTFTYSIEPVGDASNFGIAGNKLLTAAVMDYEAKSTYNVTVKVTDSAGNAFTKPFTIQVTDVNEPPTGSIVINGNAPITNSDNVTLTLTAADPENDLLQMSFSNDNVTWDPWETYAGTKTYTLSNGDGPKTVYYGVRDSAGNSSPIYSKSITLDKTPPTGTLSINSGASVTNSTNVTLGITASDANGPVEMRFANDNGTWGSWQPFSATIPWTLATGDGEKTVAMQLRDALGNESIDTIEDKITLDTTAPIVNGVSDNDIYNTSQKITFTEGTATLDGSVFNSGETVSNEGNHNFVLTDDAGNVTTVHFIIDKTAPIGTLGINGGDTHTKTADVTLDITGVDPNGPVEMRFSNDNSTWSVWEPVAAQKDWSLASGDGVKTVSMELRDKVGNSGTFTANITLDTTAPVVSGVNDGDISKDDVTITFTEGTAKLDGSSFTSGNTVTSEGNHTLILTDAAGNDTTIQFTIDKTAPTATMGINGTQTYTKNRDVNLEISATDANGPIEMRFLKDDGTWTSWEPLAVIKPWSLTAGDGPKNVSMEIRDKANNTITVQDTIILDTTPPAVSGVSDGGLYNHDVTITFLEGVAALNGQIIPTGTIVGTEGSYVLLVFDDAGNFDTIHFTIDKTAPIGTLGINGGAAYTKTTDVTLDITANDANGPVEMSFSNDNSAWSSWETAAPTKSWTLDNGDGPKSVYMKLKDAAGNESSPFPATITLDTTSPVISGVNDGDSSKNDVTITFNEGTATVDGSAFNSGDTVSTEGSHTLIVTDAVGNKTTIQFTIDKTPPTGTVTINDGAASTRTVNVTLTITASDNLGEIEMRFSNDNSTWSSWESFKATKSWTLDRRDGTKTVNMELRDEAGNVEAVNDTIQLDTYVPPQQIPVTSVSLNENTLNLKPDESASLIATVEPTNASNKQVTWRSSNPEVAQVDDNGKVTANKPGKATITVTTQDGNKTATCEVIVKEKSTFHLEASETSFVLRPDETTTVKIYSVEGNKRKEITKDKETSYRPDNDLITVKQGRITAGKNEGQSAITVSYKGEELKLQVTVEKEKVHLESSESSLWVKTKGTAHFRVYTVAGKKRKDITSDKNTKYSVDNALVTVKAGRVTAASKEGESIITVRYQGEEIEIPVTISRLTVRTLTIPIKQMVLEVDEESQLTAKATFSDRSSKDVTEDAEWSSSDSKVIEVDDDGQVTAQKIGTATITAKYGGKRTQLRVLVVNEKTPKQLRVSQSSVRIKADQKVTVTATAIYEQSFQEVVTDDAEWSTADPDIAIVDNGEITGVAKGTTKITVSYGGKTATISVTVR